MYNKTRIDTTPEFAETMKIKLDKFKVSYEMTRHFRCVTYIVDTEDFKRARGDGTLSGEWNGGILTFESHDGPGRRWGAAEGVSGGGDI